MLEMQDKNINRSGGNYALYRGTNYLVVFIQIAPVYSKFDIV